MTKTAAKLSDAIQPETDLPPEDAPKKPARSKGQQLVDILKGCTSNQIEQFAQVWATQEPESLRRFNRALNASAPG
jgi:hypothetical protein